MWLLPRHFSSGFSTLHFPVVPSHLVFTVFPLIGHVYVTSVSAFAGFFTSAGDAVVPSGAAGASPQGQDSDTSLRLHLPVSASHVASVLTESSCSHV